jgi:hypothetical protein
MTEAKSVADMLRAIEPESAKGHNLGLYVRLFADFPMRARGL